MAKDYTSSDFSKSEGDKLDLSDPLITMVRSKTTDPGRARLGVPGQKGCTCRLKESSAAPVTQGDSADEPHPTPDGGLDDCQPGDRFHVAKQHVDINKATAKRVGQKRQINPPLFGGDFRGGWTQTRGGTQEEKGAPSREGRPGDGMIARGSGVDPCQAGAALEAVTAAARW